VGPPPPAATRPEGHKYLATTYCGVVELLGIDIGGSGIKANIVDLETGELVSERHKISTPQPATPQAVATVVARMVEHFSYDGAFGCTFPGIVRGGVVGSAANVDSEWLGVDAAALFNETTGLSAKVVNDADAAAVAEERFGAAAEETGVVLVLTFGTGIGSGLISSGMLVPNTEFGHLHYDGHSPVEAWCSARVRDDEKLSWSAWAERVAAYLKHLDRVLSPDLIVIGGGISRDFGKYVELLPSDLRIVPAVMENQAGIVGAAIACESANQ